MMSEGWDSLDDDGDEGDVDTGRQAFIDDAKVIAAAFKTREGKAALVLLREKTYGGNGRDLLDFNDRKLLDAYMLHRDGQCSVMRMIDQAIGVDSGKIKVE